MTAQLDRLLDELTHDPRSDLESAAGVRGKTDRAGVHALLVAACQRALGGSPKNRADVLALLASRPEHARALRAVADDDESELSTDIALLVARMLLRTTRRSHAPLPNSPAAVASLDRALHTEWTRLRRAHPHEWLYHPRRTKLSASVIGKFIDDMRATSTGFDRDVSSGALVGDVNVEIHGGDRRKALDLVIGRPAGEPIAPAEGDRLRRHSVAHPCMTLEVKACMTAHRQSTPRLLDELMASLDVVKALGTAIIPIAVVIVNISETFTNPLHLPGPNRSKGVEIRRLFDRIVERIPLDSGTGRDHAYGAVGISVVDTDNEKHLRAVDASGDVPQSHSYGVAIARATALFGRITS